MKASALVSPFAPQTDTPVARLMSAWWSFGQVMKQHIVPRLEREHGIDFVNFIALNAINTGANYPTHICERLVMQPSGVSRIIEHLTTRGFITRSLDTDDSRRVKLEITPKGSFVLEEARVTMSELLDHGFRDVPSEQLEAFASILDRAHRTMSTATQTETAPASGRAERSNPDASSNR
jgi:DNA-binding MarR family transcriptional regulator